MQLGQLYENFAELSPELQAKFVAEYRYRRSIDLDKPSTLGRKKSTAVKSVKVSSLVLTTEEKAIMKMLGLKQKDVIALRATSRVEDNANEESEEDSASLLNDQTFDEGDE
jgi:hypothetical protein